MENDKFICNYKKCVCLTCIYKSDSIILCKNYDCQCDCDEEGKEYEFKWYDEKTTKNKNNYIESCDEYKKDWVNELKYGKVNGSKKST